MLISDQVCDVYEYLLKKKKITKRKISTISNVLVASRPASRMSSASLHHDAPPATGASDGIRDPAPAALDEEALHAAVAGEGVKLSLLAKARSIEEQVGWPSTRNLRLKIAWETKQLLKDISLVFQTSALQILLDENHLSVEDQQKALKNITVNYETLQVLNRNCRLC